MKFKIGLADLSLQNLGLNWFSRPGGKPGKSGGRGDEYLNDFLIVIR